MADKSPRKQSKGKKLSTKEKKAKKKAKRLAAETAGPNRSAVAKKGG
jgi:hypothetical protein